jgi:hypothetical protein
VTLDKLERFADAKAAYEAFLDSKPDPDKYFSKIESARDRIKAILEMPSHIKVSTTPASPPNLVVAVDRVPQAGTEMVVMPGTHSLQVVADGFTGSATVMVGPAETKEVAITLVADRPVLTVPPPTAAPAPAPAPAQVIVAAGGPSRHEARTAAYVAFGLAGVEAIVGTVFAIQAVHEKNVYDASPSPANLASVDRQTAFADVFYATGLISVVGGVVLLLIDPADAPAAKPSDKK